MPYIGKSPSAGVRQRYQYTATAGQTTFSGTDLGNLTLNYVDNNFVDVFQNGVLLKGGGTDYTATSGTSVVLATGASVSDVIEIIVYDVFSVGNFFNRTDSDSRYVNVDGDSMTGALSITTDDNTTQLTLKSTDADGSSGPLLDLTRDSASPADGDVTGIIRFRADNDAGEVTTTGQIVSLLNDASDGTEDGEIKIETTVAGSAQPRIDILPSETVFNEGSIDVDFRVEGNGNTHLIHADGAADRVGINTGKTDLSSSTGNFAVLNVGGAESNAGQQAIYCTGSKTSYAGASYNLLQNGLGIGDSSAQATGTGGALTFTGKFDGSSDQVHAATIEGYKRNGTSGEYGFNMIGRTRSNGNATMQIGFLFGPDTVQFYTANTHRFNIDNSGNLTATDTSIGSLSDERLKTNIKDHTYSLDTFKKFDVKTFDWKNPEEHGNRSSQTGLIAQEVEKVDPNFVYEYEVVEGAKDREHLTTTQISRKYTDDMDGKEKTEVRDVKLAKASKLNQKDAMYISVIQQLMAKVDALEARIKKLEDG